MKGVYLGPNLLQKHRYAVLIKPFDAWVSVESTRRLLIDPNSLHCHFSITPIRALWLSDYLHQHGHSATCDLPFPLWYCEATICLMTPYWHLARLLSRILICWLVVLFCPWLLRWFLAGDVCCAGERGISAATFWPRLQAELGTGSGWPGCLTIPPTADQRNLKFTKYSLLPKAIILNCATWTLASPALHTDIDHLRICSPH